MDWNYLYSLAAFLIGGLAGFQGVYERYRTDSAKASTTLPGFSYLFTRAVFPAGVFAVLYGTRAVETNLAIIALACGTGSELFLRSKVYIRQEQGPGNIEELLKGPLDLLRWYQNLFLEAAASGLADRRKKFLKKHLPPTEGVQVLYDTVLNNMDAWPDQQLMTDLKAEVEKLVKEFNEKALAGGSDDQLEQKYKFKLGYLIYNRVGAKGFKTLLTS